MSEVPLYMMMYMQAKHRLLKRQLTAERLNQKDCETRDTAPEERPVLIHCACDMLYMVLGPAGIARS